MIKVLGIDVQFNEEIVALDDIVTPLGNIVPGWTTGKIYRCDGCGWGIHTDVNDIDIKILLHSMNCKG